MIAEHSSPPSRYKGNWVILVVMTGVQPCLLKQDNISRDNVGEQMEDVVKLPEALGWIVILERVDTPNIKRTYTKVQGRRCGLVVGGAMACGSESGRAFHLINPTSGSRGVSAILRRLGLGIIQGWVVNRHGIRPGRWVGRECIIKVTHLLRTVG